MTLLALAGIYLAIHTSSPEWLVICVPFVAVLFTDPKRIAIDILGTFAIAIAMVAAYLYFSGKPGFN